MYPAVVGALEGALVGDRVGVVVGTGVADAVGAFVGVEVGAFAGAMQIFHWPEDSELSLVKLRESAVVTETPVYIAAI